MKNGPLREFYDGIRLIDGYEHLWKSAVKAALASEGPGTYRYGWGWSTELPRESELETIDGVTIVDKEEMLMQGVDFSAWPSWEVYKKAISENSRRNAAKAQKKYPDIEVVFSHRYHSLARVLDLVRFRDAMYKRKGLGFQSITTALAYTASILLSPSEATVASAMSGGKVLAALRLVRFGDATYYLDGASSFGADGVSWYLMLDVLERAYRETPNGKFLMGFVHLATWDHPSSAGLLRSRASLRVRNWPTSVVTFRSEAA